MKNYQHTNYGGGKDVECGGSYAQVDPSLLIDAGVRRLPTGEFTALETLSESSMSQETSLSSPLPPHNNNHHRGLGSNDSSITIDESLAHDGLQAAAAGGKTQAAPGTTTTDTGRDSLSDIHDIHIVQGRKGSKVSPQPPHPPSLQSPSRAMRRRLDE